MILTTLTLLTACASSGTTSTATGPTMAVEITGNADLETLRAAYQDAYNALPLDRALNEVEYAELFFPVWNLADSAGFTLTRKPVMGTDGFVLTAEGIDRPGHSLLLEVLGAGVTACIASTQALSPDILPESYRERVGTGPHEFIAIEGSCGPHAELLDAAFPVPDITSDGSSSETPSTTPSTAP